MLSKRKVLAPCPTQKQHAGRSPSSHSYIASAAQRSPLSWRRPLAFCLTLALVVPLGGRSGTELYAQDAGLGPVTGFMLQEQPPMGNSDRLRLGLDQYRRGQFEEAVQTLQLVDAEKLAPNDRRLLTDTLARAEAAANERRAARAEFERGEQAMDAGNHLEAIAHYRNAATNRYADEGTKAKAREQMAVAEAAMRRGGQSLRDLYNQAVADYKAGDLASARDKFRQLEAAGFRAPMFQRSPADYLRDIERRIGDEPPPLPEPTPTPQPEQQPGQPEPTPQPQPEPQPGVQPEPQPGVQPEPTPPPGEPTPTPQPQPEVTPEPQPQPVMPDGQPVPQPQPTPAPPPWQDQPPAPVGEEAPLPETVSKAEAKAAYREGRRLLREENDLAGAKRQFLIAQKGGYRPGLFETSPARYLAQIERQEQARMAQAEAEGRATGMEEQPPTPSPDQARAEAQQLVDNADAIRNTNPDQALALYSRAATLDPTNDRAIAGRDEMLRVTGRTAPAESALDIREREIRETRQVIDYTIRRNLDDARAAMGRNDFVEAQAAVQRAQVARESNPGVFSESEISQYDTMIANTRTEVRRAEEAYAAAQRRQELSAAERDAREREEIARREREATVRARIQEAQQLVREGKYDAALAVIDQILLLDPSNDYAQGARPLVQDRALFLEQRIYREQFDRELTRTLNMAEEQRVPYNDIIRYPENWPELSALRERSVALERGEQGEDAEVVQQLERRLPEVRLDNSAFADVVEFLRDVSGTNIFVNWRALEGVGIDRTTPVSARLRDVKFSKVLETILNDVGGGTVKLGYTIDDGVITISTEEDLASNVVTRVYDIRDLILNVPDFDNAPDFSIQGSTAGGQGGGGLFGGNLGDEEGEGTQTRNELVEAIIALIQDTVASDSWKDNGGSVGSIRELSGQLIVTQTPENQRALVRLLDQLRETRAIQVTVEARFLVVQRNFLEDVGVDFDFTFNNADPDDPDRRFSPITVSQNSFIFNEDTAALDTTVPGNIGLELSSRNQPVIPMLTTGFTYLDDFQVSLLIRATQASQYSHTLTAPRLTLFNGQRAFVVVATETAFVSDLTPIVGTNAVAFDPQPGVIQSGVLLDVVATVSSDRKYVTLTLRPTLSRLRDLVQFPVTALTAGGGDDGGVPISQTAFLQQPVRDITSVQTTVSVPDGGTLLIGGQTLNGEIEREGGVPVLSKVPFLKRLFTNRSVAKDDQVLLILIRPTIIILREQEAEQFPLLGSRTGG